MLDIITQSYDNVHAWHGLNLDALNNESYSKQLLL